MRRSIVIAVALLGTGAVTPLAWSEDPAPPPPEGPAISQYVETIPSGTGGQAVGVGKSRAKPLPKHAAKKLNRQTTPLAPKLRSIATSSSYGAPQQTLPRRASTAAKPAKASKPRARPPAHRSHRSEKPVRSAEPDRTALSAAVSAATGGGDRGPVILLAVIVLCTTAAGLLAAAKRARQRR
jgi:hypothetical protein